jgi:pSer/pThr/pTyr-binding forkhead associated (FHA) protein
MSTAAASLHLEVISGNAPGSTIVVEDELVIGRHASGAGRLSDDAEISRQHARILREATGEYAIEDLGSSNGTFVNGLRIQSPRLLSLGDSIEAGATTLVVKEIVHPAPVETAAPDVADNPPSDPRSAPTMFARVPTSQVTPTPPQATPAPPQAPSQTKHAVPTPPLELTLKVDFDACEAWITLGKGGQVVRLVLEDGGWQTSAE